MKIVVLDAYTTNPGDLSWDWLKKYGDPVIYDYTDPRDTVERASGCDILIDNKTPLGADVLDRLGDKLKYIGLLSTGFNIVDCTRAAQLGIPVTNIPTYSTLAVAQMTTALLLELCSKVGMHSEAVKRGVWSSGTNFCFWLEPLVELCGKTLGIVGFGKIGASVAKIADAMGMKVVAFTPHPPQNAPERVRFVSLDELLRLSDAVTMHCPLTPDTQGMVNADFLAAMKPGSLFINTSRGTVVNENDLAAALESGHLAGAALDVMSSEPPQPDNPLLSCKSCVITPHISWAAFETRRRLLSICEQNLAAFLSGKPENVVNP